MLVLAMSQIIALRTNEIPGAFDYRTVIAAVP
jgi:hypothetical protein